MGESSALDLDALAPSAMDAVVAVEPKGDCQAEVYFRKDGKTLSELRDCRPFLLLADPAPLAGLPEVALVPLAGGAKFAWKAEFPGLKAMDAAVKLLKEKTKFNPSAPGAPYRVFTDDRQRSLMTLGVRLFRGMPFSELRRLQFDIETLTTPGFDFPNPERLDDRIVSIALCDSQGWERCLFGPEREMLEDFVRLVRERDPDTIEGHNIFRFDLPYLEARAKRHKVKMLLGRDGSPWTARSSRISFAEQTLNYRRYDVHGRHMVDTYFLTRLYDVSHRDLPEYGLKAVARHFGVAAPGRVLVDASDIAGLLASDPERLQAYNLDDAREARSLSNLLSPSYFHQAGIMPFAYQDCVVRGNATRIDAMLVDAYLREGQSVPEPGEAAAFTGALTEAFESGVFPGVWHCDVRSLYPSVILAEGWSPCRDRLGKFPFFLKTLREFRLRAKDAERTAADPGAKDHFNALQTTFKIVINSFYGYLGFAQGTFNDYGMAAQVTAKGRAILGTMLDFLRRRGAKVIEMDTDGIYFQPPRDVASPAAMGREVQAVLPPGIEVELDATYAAMFCYKSKNYATLQDDGEIGLTGAALKSRGLEPFLRDYLRDFITSLLRGEAAKIETMTDSLRQDIESRSLPLVALCKAETLTDSLDTYKRKLAAGEGRRGAVYELALASGRGYSQGDQVSYYVTGAKKKVSVVDNSRLLRDAPAVRDENVSYYLDKLDEAYKKFAVFLPPAKGQGDLFELKG